MIKDLEMTASEKIAAVTNLKQNLEENFIQLGQLLSEMKRTKLYKYKSYKNFKEFVEAEFNFPNSFANKIISNFELFIKKLDVDEYAAKKIGLDKLNMIKPLVKKAEVETAEEWIDKAENLTTTDLREEVKEERERQRSQEKTLKEVYIEQYLEKMVMFFNCSRKELDFKLALFFQDKDMEEIEKEIKIKSRKYDEEQQNVSEGG